MAIAAGPKPRGYPNTPAMIMVLPQEYNSTTCAESLGSRKSPSMDLPRITPKGLPFRLEPSNGPASSPWKSSATWMPGCWSSATAILLSSQGANPYRTRQVFGPGSIKVNFLVNYGWRWDLDWGLERQRIHGGRLVDNIASADISRVDLIIRWGGRRRLSGFLPRPVDLCRFLCGRRLLAGLCPRTFLSSPRVVSDSGCYPGRVAPSTCS